MAGFLDLAGGLGVDGHERFLCTEEGRSVSTEDLELVFFDVPDTKAVLLFLEGEETPLMARNIRFHELEEILPERFVKPHGYYLVDRTRIEAVSGAPARYRLHLRGSGRTVDVTSTFEDAIADTLGVRTLERLVPEHPEDRRLRELALYDFGAREVGLLDIEDEVAVRDFRLRWDLTLWNSPELLRYFGKITKPDELDEKKLVRNIIWQAYRWMWWGIREPWNSALRQFWYMVERVFESQTDVQVEVTSDQYNSILNEMIHQDKLFTYRQFGFFDVRSRFRDIGNQEPHIVLVDEKEGNYLALLRTVPDLRYTIACTKGQPSLIMLDYLVEELSNVANLDQTRFHFFTIMDLDPPGRFIQWSVVNGLRERGLSNIHHFSLVRADLISAHFPIPILLEKARTIMARYVLVGDRRVPYGPGSDEASLEEAWEFWEKIGRPGGLRTVDLEDGREVWSLWKLSAGSYNRALINEEFHQIAERILAGEPPGIPEEGPWNQVMTRESLHRWRPDIDLEETSLEVGVPRRGPSSGKER